MCFARLMHVNTLPCELRVASCHRVTCCARYREVNFQGILTHVRLGSRRGDPRPRSLRWATASLIFLLPWRLRRIRLCAARLVLRESPALQEHNCYMLGTDFKAGQTKFKTAAVEYIRALGMCPKVRSVHQFDPFD